MGISVKRSAVTAGEVLRGAARSRVYFMTGISNKEEEEEEKTRAISLIPAHGCETLTCFVWMRSFPTRRVVVVVVVVGDALLYSSALLV